MGYAAGVSEIQSSNVVAFYLFDVAESADLRRGAGTHRRSDRAGAARAEAGDAAYVQYDKPPLSFEGEAVGVPEIDGFRTRVRVYDYGVMSVALMRAFDGSWADFVGLGQPLIENAELEQRAEQLCRVVIDRLRTAFVGAARGRS